MELATTSISNILKQSIGKLHFSDIDIKKVERNCFSIRYNSGGIMSAWYGSTLYVEVKESLNSNFETVITCKIKVSWIIYLNFFSLLTIGLGYLIAFFVTKNTIALLNASILMIAIPAFYIWISSINNYAIKDRYLELVHKELRKIEISNEKKHN